MNYVGGTLLPPTLHEGCMVMNKFIKSLLLVILVVLLVSLSTFGVFADTIYTYNGYSFTMMENNYISVCGWDNSSEDFDVPAQLDGSYVKEIADMGMRSNEYITSLNFSDAIYMTRIGNMAFKGCTNISGTVSVPARVTDVGIAAFQECKGIENFNFYSGTVVPMQCCYLCSSLKNVTVSEGVTTIEKLAFASCEELESVRLPRSLTSINISSFNNSPKVVLYVYFDSYAYEFAKTNNINYSLLDGIKLGDVNGDNIVNVDDATLIQKYLAELETIEGIYLYAADSNEDTEIDVSDATAIQMYSVELQTGHPIGQVMTK